MNPQPIPHTRNLFTTSVGNILGKCEHSTYYNNKLFHQYHTFVITFISYKWYQHCNSFLKGGVSLGLKRVTILCRVLDLSNKSSPPPQSTITSPARYPWPRPRYCTSTAPITKCNISEKNCSPIKFCAGASAVVELCGEEDDRGITPHHWLPAYRVAVQGSTTRDSKRQKNPLQPRSGQGGENQALFFHKPSNSAGNKSTTSRVPEPT